MVTPSSKNLIKPQWFKACSVYLPQQLNTHRRHQQASQRRMHPDPTTNTASTPLVPIHQDQDSTLHPVDMRRDRTDPPSLTNPCLTRCIPALPCNPASIFDSLTQTGLTRSIVLILVYL